jgi:hypothetical protein
MARGFVTALLILDDERAMSLRVYAVTFLLRQHTTSVHFIIDKVYSKRQEREELDQISFRSREPPGVTNAREATDVERSTKALTIRP